MAGGDEETDCALVQVLTYGLSVVDRSQLNKGRLLVRFRKVHGHEMSLLYRDDGAGSEWFEKDVRDYRRIRFDLPRGALQAGLDDEPAQGCPLSSVEASEARWLLHSSDLEFSHNNAFKPAKAQPKAVFRVGTLETCGLTHDENFDICRIRSGGADTSKTLERCVSEYMVIRHPVRGTGPLRVDLDGDVVEVPRREVDGGIKWRNTRYHFVYDVILHNVPPEAKEVPEVRDLSTEHAALYLRPLFPLASNSWQIAASVGSGSASRCEDAHRQPSCFDYFFRGGMPAIPRSGPTHEVCPMVGYP